MDCPAAKPFLVAHDHMSKLEQALSAADYELQTCLLSELAACNRINCLAAIGSARHGWIGACLSVAEILTALYSDPLLSPPTASGIKESGQPASGPEPGYGDYPLIVLGKGHAAAMQYACLAAKGFIPVEHLLKYKCADGPQAHTDRCTRGIVCNTGSLGQALSKCCGLAAASPRSRVVAILGDGEMQEGQNFEALMSISRFNLANLITIIDRNGLQSDSTVAEIMPIADLAAVLGGMGLSVFRLRAANEMQAVRKCLHGLNPPARPTAVIADTMKGAGVSFMAARAANRRGYAWHGGIPDRDQYLAALAELGNAIRLPELQVQLDAYVADYSQKQAQPRPPTKSKDLSSAGMAFGESLVHLAAEYESLHVLDADLEKPCRLRPFAETFPERFHEIGIAEQNMVSFAGGLALRGLVPVVNTYAAFFRRAYEQVYVNTTEGTRIIYAGHYAGLCYTTDGKTHQCTGDIAMMRAIPGMNVLYPAFPEQVEPMLRYVLRNPDTGPVYFRLHRTPASPADELGLGQQDPAWGQTFSTKNAESATFAVLTAGPHMARFCVEAAREVEGSGGPSVAVHVIADFGLLPREFAAFLESQYRWVGVVEETVQAGGLFDLVAASLAESGGIRRPELRRKCVHNLTFSTREPRGLYNHFGLDSRSLATWLRIETDCEKG